MNWLSDLSRLSLFKSRGTDGHNGIFGGTCTSASKWLRLSGWPTKLINSESKTHFYTQEPWLSFG